MHNGAMQTPTPFIAPEVFDDADAALQRVRLEQLSRFTDVPVLALPRVHMHVRSRKRLQDVLTAIRVGQPLAECGRRLFPNAEQHLRSRLRLANLHGFDLSDELERRVLEKNGTPIRKPS